MSDSLTRIAIRSLQKLEPHSNYAIVFNKPLSKAQLDELVDVCKKAESHVLVLVDAQVVQLDEAIVMLSKEQAGGQ